MKIELDKLEKDTLKNMIDIYKDYLNLDYKDDTGEEPYFEWDFINKLEKLIKQDD